MEFQSFKNYTIAITIKLIMVKGKKNKKKHTIEKKKKIKQYIIVNIIPVENTKL